jgi:ribose transport system ATP-binding protein
LTLFECESISKSFFGATVLRDVGFTLEAGQVLGLVGENGAGKSTLMNILGGVLAADIGQMRLFGESYTPGNPAEASARGIAFIHQELNLFTNLSICENLFITSFPRRRIAGIPWINRTRLREATSRLLDLVELPIDPEILVERLSPGERQLVEIAKALSVDARLIIFDEPTTSLSARESAHLFGIIERLRSEGRSLVYISHVLEDVLRLVDEILVLRDGEIVGRGSKSQFDLGQLIALMVGRQIEQLYPPRCSVPSQEVALELKEVSQPGIVENVSFQLYKGEILGIAGLMGSGRSELARIAFGLETHARGTILLNGRPLSPHTPKECVRRKIAFLTENRREEGLLMEWDVARNLALVQTPFYIRSPLRLIRDAVLLGRVAATAEQVRLDAKILQGLAVKSLSGGNQQKVVLGKWLVENPAVFVLDEPTRGIDVGTRYEVYKIINQLASGGTALLVISSEIEELMGLCDRILVMCRGEIAASFMRDQFDREAILRSALRMGAVSGSTA